MSAFTNFNNFIEDFSNNKKYAEIFEKTFGITPEECSKLSFDENLSLTLDTLMKNKVKDNNVERKIDNSMKKLNLGAKSQSNFLSHILSLPQDKMFMVMMELNKLMESHEVDPFARFGATQEALESRGFKNYDIYCPVCKTTHWTNEGHLDEPVLLDHLEISFKYVFNYFLKKSNHSIKARNYINVRFNMLTEKMHKLFQKFIEVRKIDFNLMKILHACYRSSVAFLTEFTLTLLNVLKESNHEDTHKMLLIGKTIHELMKGLNEEFLLSAFRAPFLYIRKTVQTYLFNFFEEMYDKLSDTNLCMNCLAVGVKANAIDEMIKATDEMYKRLEGFTESTLDVYFEAIEEIVDSTLSDKYIKLFELMEKEFHNNFKEQFLKLFTENAYEKYKQDNEPSVEERNVFDKGKQVENVIHLCINSLKEHVMDLINTHIDKCSFEAKFPSNVFIRTGNKFWHDYDYTEDQDPLLHHFLRQSDQVKRNLLKRLTSDFDVEPVIIPVEFNQTLSEYNSLKTDEDWLQNYVPIDVTHTYKALYFYFLSHPKISKKLIVTSNTPDLNRLTEDEIRMIKRIFKISTKELSKFIEGLSGN